MKKHFRLLGVAALATTMLTGCSNDELVETNQGEAIAFRARTETRATNLTLDNLGDFKVYAKGVHQTGELYTQFLIGTTQTDETNQQENTVGETAKKQSSNKWELDHNVYWPSDMKRVFFWAYTTNSTTNESSDCLSSGKMSFDTHKGPILSGFQPAKADLKASSTTGTWNDGDNQKDLLIAFTDQEKTKGISSIPLKFTHALSQIEIKATQKGKASTDNRIVKIKGAWIVNVYNKADLEAGFSWENGTASDNKVWKNFDGLSTYGSYANSAQTLSSESAINLLGQGDNNGSLMLIPQTVTKWDSNNNTTTGTETTTDTDNEIKTNTYILLLCRVELKHKGSTHEGNPNDIWIGENEHYHQLFPSTELTNNVYNANAYSFSCVPLSNTWEMNKKYIYTLNICGDGTGAGVYPPTFSLDDLVPTASQTNIILGRPQKKEIGDPVLDDPITFSVDVEEWTSTEKPATDIDTPLQ